MHPKYPLAPRVPVSARSHAGLRLLSLPCDGVALAIPDCVEREAQILAQTTESRIA